MGWKRRRLESGGPNQLLPSRALPPPPQLVTPQPAQGAEEKSASYQRSEESMPDACFAEESKGTPKFTTSTPQAARRQALAVECC